MYKMTEKLILKANSNNFDAWKYPHFLFFFFEIFGAFSPCPSYGAASECEWALFTSIWWNKWL